jgi:hypothetical protein
LVAHVWPAKPLIMMARAKIELWCGLGETTFARQAADEPIRGEIAASKGLSQPDFRSRKPFGVSTRPSLQLKVVYWSTAAGRLWDLAIIDVSHGKCPLMSESAVRCMLVDVSAHDDIPANYYAA